MEAGFEVEPMMKPILRRLARSVALHQLWRRIQQPSRSFPRQNCTQKRPWRLHRLWKCASIRSRRQASRLGATYAHTSLRKPHGGHPEAAFFAPSEAPFRPDASAHLAASSVWRQGVCGRDDRPSRQVVKKSKTKKIGPSSLATLDLAKLSDLTPRPPAASIPYLQRRAAVED